jgi:4-amino-4-deoxy-L-arabinose transferase-like glycosyltransferase
MLRARRPLTAPLAIPAARRAALGVLLVASGALYSAGVSRSGWANAYYSAAAQAGALSWKAMLFGGLDPAGGITVDKPPAALWLTSLSVRLFGLSSWSLLLPQALCGVVAVALLYATVRRQAATLGGPDGQPDGGARAAGAGLLAAAALALTPAVTLMARYDNPDALMVLLSVAAAWALVRSVTAAAGGGGWLALSGALLGLGFLTKLLQAELVVPAFALAALVAGAGSLRRRLARLAVAGAALLASAGWWVLLVQLTPAADRPWIGGTQHDSVLELALGYNGFGRLTGQESGGGAADRVRAGSWGRLFGSWAPQASWLLPAALAALVAGWVLTRGRDRRDPVRAGLLLWGGWLAGVGAVLSSLHGISHSYYAVQLAPAVAGSVALGGGLVWRRAAAGTDGRVARRLIALGLAATALWSVRLLFSRPGWPLTLAPFVVAAAGLAAFGVLSGRAGGADRTGPSPARPVPGSRAGRAVVLAAVVVSLLGGSAIWSVATAQAVHRGADVVAGPLLPPPAPPAGVRSGSTTGTGIPVRLAVAVRAGAPGFRWAAAVVGRRAADLQLDSGVPVWDLGGYSGHDPHPTAAGFRAAVAAHRIHYLAVPGPLGLLSSPFAQLTRDAVGTLPVRPIDGWLLVDLTGGHPSIGSG